MTTEIIMPEMGEGVIEGTIARWLKSEGDQVKQYEPLLEIETDKVTTEAVAEEAGVLLKVMVNAGETVEVGTVLGVIGAAGEQGDPVAATATRAHATPAAAPVREAPRHVNGGPSRSQSQSQSSRSLGRISPVVSRMAEEHDIDLYQVDGSGRNGRITKKDVLAYLEQRETTAEPAARAPQPAPAAATAPKPQPAVQAAVSRAVGDQVQPLSNMRRAIADHMVHSKRTSPHVTTVFEVDFSRIFSHRNQHKQQFADANARLTFTPYIIMATAQALRRHPAVNSSWTEDGLLLRSSVNIGMATAIDAGLIVPVIRNADEFNLMGLARRVNDLAERARSNRLQPGEVQDGSFTVTNHGVSGSLFATPIINQPQAGILGVGKIQKRPVVIESELGDSLAIRPMAYLSFTFDHRILDGASADAFVETVVDLLQNWREA